MDIREGYGKYLPKTKTGKAKKKISGEEMEILEELRGKADREQVKLRKSIDKVIQDQNELYKQAKGEQDPKKKNELYDRCDKISAAVLEMWKRHDNIDKDFESGVDDSIFDEKGKLKDNEDIRTTCRVAQAAINTINIIHDESVENIAKLKAKKAQVEQAMKDKGEYEAYRARTIKTVGTERKELKHVQINEPMSETTPEVKSSVMYKTPYTPPINRNSMCSETSGVRIRKIKIPCIKRSK